MAMRSAQCPPPCHCPQFVGTCRDPDWKSPIYLGISNRRISARPMDSFRCSGDRNGRGHSLFLLLLLLPLLLLLFCSPHSTAFFFFFCCTIQLLVQCFCGTYYIIIADMSTTVPSPASITFSIGRGKPLLLVSKRNYTAIVQIRWLYSENGKSGKLFF